MGLLYSAEWTSMTGDQYTVQIIDSTLQYDPEIAIDLGPDGFVIDYEGDPKNLTRGIIPSSCSISMLIPDASFETFISDLANSAENRFFVDIYHGSGNLPFWRGNIVPDICSFPDADFPYIFNLKAIDGLAKLKDVTLSSSYFSSQIDDLVSILSNLETSILWDSNDIFLLTAVNWYNSVMGTPSSSLDPLTKTLSSDQCYSFFDSKKQLQHTNCYHALEMLTTLWNARLFIANGRFYFIQINELKNPSTYIRYYDISGNQISSGSLNLEVTGIQRTGNFSYLRPVKIVSIEQNYWASYVSNRLPALTNYSNSIDVGMFSAGNGESLKIIGDILVDVSDSGNNQVENQVHFQLKINVGDYYLKNPGGIFEWTTNSNAAVDIYPYDVEENYNYYKTISISIDTPKIPKFGNSEFSLNFLQFENPDGNKITPPATVSWSFSYSNFNLTQTVMPDTVKIKHSETGTTGGTEYEKKLPEISMGDGPSSDANTKLKVYNNSTSSWEDSRDKWSEGGIGTPTWINQLLVKKNLALQSTARLRFNGTIANVDYRPYQTFTINSHKFTLLSASFYANRKEWRGYFHEIKET